MKSAAAVLEGFKSLHRAAVCTHNKVYCESLVFHGSQIHVMAFPAELSSCKCCLTCDDLLHQDGVLGGEREAVGAEARVPRDLDVEAEGVIPVVGAAGLRCLPVRCSPIPGGGFQSDVLLQCRHFCQSSAAVNGLELVRITKSVQSQHTCSESEICCPSLGTASAIVPPPAPPGWSCGTGSGSCPVPPFTWKRSQRSHSRSRFG